MGKIRISPRAIIRKDNQYLVVRYRDNIGDWYVFPGGGLQYGEDLAQGLKREVEEETGIQPEIGQLRFVRDCIAARGFSENLPMDTHQVEIFFECTIKSETTGKVTNPDPGQIDFDWLTIEELQNRRFFPKPILDQLLNNKTAYIGVC